MKTRMMVNTPTRVLLVRDWTIFFDTVCMAAGKSCKMKRNKVNDFHIKATHMLNKSICVFTLMHEYMAQMKRMLASMMKILI